MENKENIDEEYAWKCNCFECFMKEQVLIHKAIKEKDDEVFYKRGVVVLGKDSDLVEEFISPS